MKTLKDITLIIKEIQLKHTLDTVFHLKID